MSCFNIIVSIEQFVWGETTEHRFIWTSVVNAQGCYWCDSGKTSLSQQNRQSGDVTWWQGKLLVTDWPRNWWLFTGEPAGGDQSVAGECETGRVWGVSGAVRLETVHREYDILYSPRGKSMIH